MPKNVNIAIHAFGFKKDSDGDYDTYNGVKIFAKKGSTAEKYCKKNYLDMVTWIENSSVDVSGLGKKTYTGKAIRPAITVRVGSKKLKEGRDYSVEYKNNTKVGTATLTITGDGSYYGTASKKFTIIPKGTEITTLASRSKGFKASWKTVNKQVTGYQIRYSLKSSMNGSKKKTIRSYKTGTVSASNLKAGKKYYVQVRTYKKVNDKTYYSRWSDIETVTTKK